MGHGAAVSDLDDKRDAVVETLTKLGTTCTIVDVAGALDTNGAYSETTTKHTARCSDLVDEHRRYSSLALTGTTVSGTFYVAAKGLNMTPANADRISYQGRSYAVLAVFPYRAHGGLVAWRLDVSDIGEDQDA